ASRDNNEYWSGRYIWQNALPLRELNALRLMQQVRNLAHILLTQTFVHTPPLYSDTAQLVRWHPGLLLNPHADNIEPDGRPNGTPHRAYSSILYLNDDYEGGATFFPGLSVRVRPRTGALLLFGAGYDYVHGVTPITRGMRYTYAGWFTHEPMREDALAQIVF